MGTFRPHGVQGCFNLCPAGLIVDIDSPLVHSCSRAIFCLSNVVDVVKHQLRDAEVGFRLVDAWLLHMLRGISGWLDRRLDKPYLRLNAAASGVVGERQASTACWLCVSEAMRHTLTCFFLQPSPRIFRSISSPSLCLLYHDGHGHACTCSIGIRTEEPHYIVPIAGMHR